MIRITGGRLKGQQITCPKGKAVRPTTAFVRESLFSILASRIQGAQFLDLFAGCGIVGIEALSRGADTVLALDKAGGHCRILTQNRDKLGIPPEQYEILCQDAFQWAKQWTGKAFDIVYLDPPYALQDTVMPILEACFEKQILASNGVLIWESTLRQPPAPQGATYIETRTYGESTLSLFRHPEWPGPQTG